MFIKINDENKIVSLWLTKAENADANLRAGLMERLSTYRKKNYLISVFSPGDSDLYENTLGLLLRNKRRSAELEVQRQKLTANSG